jgi:hypothetical protein
MMNAVPMRERTEPSLSVISIAWSCCSERPISAAGRRSDKICCYHKLYTGGVIAKRAVPIIASQDSGSCGRTVGACGGSEDLGDLGPGIHLDIQLESLAGVSVDGVSEQTELEGH